MWILQFVIFLVCFSCLSANLTHTSSEVTKLALSSFFNEYTDLLHIIIQTNLEENKVIFSDMLQEILNEQWYFRIQVDVNNEQIQDVGDYNLWFIDSYESFRHLVPLIRAHGGDSPVYYFIVLTTTGTPINLIERIFNDMLPLMVVNINIIIEVEFGDVVSYTYFPYRESFCRSTVPLEIFRFSKKPVTNQRHLDFYPTKAENLDGCTLRIPTRNPTFFRGVRNYKGLLEVGGLEIAIINELASRMNFKVQLIERFIHEKVLYLKNGTAFGPYNLIEEGKADIMIGFYKHGPLQDRFVTPSPTYFFNWVSIALWRPPYTFRKLSWLFIPFDVTTWFLMMALLIMATACVFIVTKIPFLVRFLAIHPNRTRITNVSSMALGLSIENLPSTHFIRFCFIVWSLGTLTIRATYEGKLFDAYRSLAGAHTPLTVRQLLAENYTIYSQFTYAFVLNELGGIGSFTYQKLPITKLLGNSTQNNAVIASFVYMYEVYDPEELENMIIEPLFYEHVCLFMQKHSILAPKINDIISRMEEGGLFNRWRAHYEALKVIHFSLHKDIDKEPTPIALDQFKYTLLLFLAPTLVSIMVFIFEVYWRKVKNRFRS